MPAHTIHAEVRALERYGVEPSAADWSAAVDAIIGVVAGKLSRGTFAVSFFLAVLHVLELEGVTLADL